VQIERVSPEFDIAHNLGHIDPEKFPMTWVQGVVPSLVLDGTWS